MERSAGSPPTLLIVLAHPDDELGAAGTIRVHRSLGHRVVILYLTRGEATQAFGPLAEAEVARRRMQLAERAADILDVDHRFLDLPDTAVHADPATARRVAEVLAEVRPDALLTWGRHWVKGMRHPDHHACGTLAVDAVTLARIARVVAPAEPHRAPCPVFTFRGVHSTLPSVIVDVSDHVETVMELAEFYFREIGFGERAWLEARLRAAGAEHGVEWAERWDAWESEAGVIPHLLAARPLAGPAHPTRAGSVDGSPPSS